MRAITYRINGTDYYFAFTNSAYLKTQERWPDAENTIDIIDREKPDNLECLCQMAVILAEGGELARRYYGYDAGPMLEYEQLADIPHVGTPAEVMSLRAAVVKAISLGFKREIEEPEQAEVDLGLIELKKQKKTGES